MTEMLHGPVTGRCVWTVADVAADASWIHRFSPAELDEMDGAARTLAAGGKRPEAFERDDFPLPTLAPRLAALRREIEYGRGFALLRGIDVSRYDMETLKVLYWGLGTHLGEIISQNSQGDLLGTVTDMEAGRYATGGYYEQNVRGHRTNAYLPPHSDSCDVVGLLCVRPAQEGGASTISSSMAIYNEILRTRPEFIAPLTEGFHFDLIGKGTQAVEVTRNRVPVFSWCEGVLSCRFNKQQIELGAAKAGHPLTPLQQAAVDYVEELAVRPDFQFPMAFEPGDIQLLNNHTTLHSRTGYRDWDAPEKRRLLLRLWLNVPDGRPLAPAFADRLNTGSRGGVTRRL